MEIVMSSSSLPPCCQCERVGMPQVRIPIEEERAVEAREKGGDNQSRLLQTEKGGHLLSF